MAELETWLEEEIGYQWIQGTRPQTLAFGLSDSPVGLAAWIVEKFRAWTDCGGDPRNALDDGRDAGRHQPVLVHELHRRLVLAVLRAHARRRGRSTGKIDVPMGYCEFPREILRPPREAAQRVFTDIRRWTVMQKRRALRRARAARGTRARHPRLLLLASGHDRGNDTPRTLRRTCCARCRPCASTPIPRRRASGSRRSRRSCRSRDTTARLTLLRLLEEQAQQRGIVANVPPYSAYRNTIPPTRRAPIPAISRIEERLTSIMRWNALAMVVRANSAYGELGGHIGSYASAAEIFETGFNHFFRADEGRGGDLVFFQPHSAPGRVRARIPRRPAHRRASRELSAGSRRPRPVARIRIRGSCPSSGSCRPGSMGIGPISAIYQARFMRYLANRGIADTTHRRVWGVFGDGEMDEPESVGALTLAARENLDNLTFVINCNLQRLDGPVRGNGQIIQELEALFSGAGWNVIKVLWGSDWDTLFARDRDAQPAARIRRDARRRIPDARREGRPLQPRAFLRPRARRFARSSSDMSEARDRRAAPRRPRPAQALLRISRRATLHRGQPTVILAKTKKGFGMGEAGESRMTVHQQKKLDVDALLRFRDRFALPIGDDAGRRALRSSARRTTARRCGICAAPSPRSAVRCLRGGATRRPSPCRRSTATRSSRSPRKARRCRRPWPPCGS